MAVFALPGFEGLAPREQVRACALGRFPNGELHVRLEADVAGLECVLVGSAAPPDEQILALTLAAHTLVKEGASRVRALLPYLGYARQDRPEPGRSLAAAWVGELLGASGVDEVVTVDAHSADAVRLFPIPVVSLSPAALFAPEIRHLGLKELTVVAPDEGALERCEALRAAVGVERPVAWLAKRRTPWGTVHLGLNGELSRTAVVVDDIVDTGGTLVSCCGVLSEAGVEEIAIVVTHGLFSGDGWRGIWAAGASRLVTTDTVPGRAPVDPRVAVLSARPLLEEWLGATVG
jgi:ribose-phosphate pyrophosphokinase